MTQESYVQTMGDGIKLFLLCLVIWLIPWIAIPVILLWLGLNWEPRDEECSIIITVPASEINEMKPPVPRKKKHTREDSLVELQRELDLARTQSAVGSVWDRQLKALEV